MKTLAKAQAQDQGIANEKLNPNPSQSMDIGIEAEQSVSRPSSLPSHPKHSQFPL